MIDALEFGGTSRGECDGQTKAVYAESAFQRRPNKANVKRRNDAAERKGVDVRLAAACPMRVVFDERLVVAVPQWRVGLPTDLGTAACCWQESQDGGANQQGESEEELKRAARFSPDWQWRHVLGATATLVNLVYLGCLSELRRPRRIRTRQAEPEIIPES